MLKRTFDFVLSFAGLVVLSPLLAALAIMIKTGSRGPVFYRGLRAGRDGIPFRIFKFRSMVVDAERLGGSSTSDTDPRITSVGKLMRKYKLDELPQLMNVLLADMSLVGPRPQVLEYVERFSDEEKAVLRVRPGITDWASIWNSDEGGILARFPDADKAYDELIHPTKMRLQLLYVRQNNLWIDLKILWYTLVKIARRSWTPHELRDYPLPGEPNPSYGRNFETVTELPGAPVNAEQLQMLHTRYSWAGKLVRDKDVLEVACGPGIGLGHLAARAKRVVGGDYDAKLAAIARQQFGGRIDVQQMDAHSLPFPDGSFDVVIMFEAIYYLDQPTRFIREAHRVLRDDGRLLLCSANCERPDFNVSPYSKQYYSARELAQLLEQSGFRATTYVGFPLRVQNSTDRIRDIVRRLAVKLHLIPKTMKWKARLKRVFFGRLQKLPGALGETLPPPEPMIRVEPRAAAPGYKVVYAIGERRAMEQRAAA